MVGCQQTGGGGGQETGDVSDGGGGGGVAAAECDRRDIVEAIRAGRAPGRVEPNKHCEKRAMHVGPIGQKVTNQSA
jgi:hypothetical protein